MKIRLSRLSPGQGGIGTDGTVETCVVEHGENYPVPAGAEKVSDNTPLSDWAPEKPHANKKKEEGA